MVVVFVRLVTLVNCVSHDEMMPLSMDVDVGLTCGSGWLFMFFSVLFAVGVLSDLYAFHRSTGNFLYPYRTPTW